MGLLRFTMTGGEDEMRTMNNELGTMNRINEQRATSNEQRILGIDEAGRGPVIGPLVICGVVLSSSNLLKLSEKGVRDSKKLTASKREKLKGEIQLLAEGYELIIIPPQAIDREGMNDLELKGVVKLIDKFLPDEVFLDAPTRNCLSFERKIRELLATETKVELVVENFADENYPIVGAASILAKVERDRRISELEKEYGTLGSGYPSDEKTIRFLKKYLNHYGCFPPIARKKWKTLARIRSNNGVG